MIEKPCKYARLWSSLLWMGLNGWRSAAWIEVQRVVGL